MKLSLKHKLTSDDLGNATSVTVYIDDSEWETIQIKYPSDLKRGIWQYNHLFLTW